MNHQNLYDKLILSCGTKKKPKNRYTERHHIVPKCMGGTNEASNLVYLPSRVHFICHRLLCKIHPTNTRLKFAFWAMCNQLGGDVDRKYKVSSNTFKLAREEFAKANSILHTGKKLSEKHIAIIRERCITHNPNAVSKYKGISRSVKTVQAMRDSLAAIPRELRIDFRGYWVTPQGKFVSSNAASKIVGMKDELIRSYCKKPNKIVSEQMVRMNPFLCLADVGKTLRELGWDFQPALPQLLRPNEPLRHKLLHVQ